MWKHPISLSAGWQCESAALIYFLKQQDLFWFIIWLNWHFYTKRNYKFISIYPLLVFGNTMISALNIKATNVSVTTNQIPQISKFGNLSDLESGVFSTDRVTPGWVTSFSYKIKCKQSPQPKQKVTCLVRETLLVLLWKTFPFTQTSQTLSSPADMHPV